MFLHKYRVGGGRGAGGEAGCCFLNELMHLLDFTPAMTCVIDACVIALETAQGISYLLMLLAGILLLRHNLRKVLGFP